MGIEGGAAAPQPGGGGGGNDAIVIMRGLEMPLSMTRGGWVDGSSYQVAFEIHVTKKLIKRG